MLSLSFVLCLFGHTVSPTAWVLGSAPASPSSLVAKARIAIAPIAYAGSIPEHTRVAVHATVVETVQSIARDALLLDVDAECRTRECALRQARDANAEYLLEVRLTLEQRDYAIELAIIDAKDGRQLTESSGQCPLCAQAELLAELVAQVATVEPAIAPRTPPPPTIEWPSTVPTPPRERAERSRRSLQIGGWVSFALGLAGAGAGAALLALDGQEHGPTCSIAARDINGACPNVYTTGPAGIVSVSVGGAVLATGMGLLIAAGAKHERRRTARLSSAGKRATPR